MYYEETIRGNQTYFRKKPNGKWKPKSNQEFTKQVANLKKRIIYLKLQAEEDSSNAI